MNKSIMLLVYVICFAARFIGYSVQRCTNVPSDSIKIVSREEWGANPAKSSTQLKLPIPMVVIHHSYLPSACHKEKDCEHAMRTMQNVHQVDNRWVDIGYNFGVGGDGKAYEGRGWKSVGAHAVKYNSISIGIVVIGDWGSVLPPSNQLETVKALITLGITEGYIQANYLLVGHRQVGATDCPGDAFFKEIAKWPNYQSNSEYPFKFYSAEAWGAANPTDVTPLKTPVPYVVIHHTYIPGACYNFDDCSRSMRGMQNYHMGMNWGDIGYHFCVASEGGAYEGRGWTTLGIHARQANNYSIGICLIGDFREELPTPIQLETTKSLIAVGVSKGYISPNYKLIGHQQVSATECPGAALLREIATWPNYTREPFNITSLKL